MTDIADFLLARIAEDEAPNRAWFASEPEDPEKWGEWHDARAESWHARTCGWRLGEGISEGCECELPARVLAECEAKRQIMKWEASLIASRPPTETHQMEQWSDGEVTVYTVDGKRETMTWNEYVERYTVPAPPSNILRLLALPYSSHPDYQQEWNMS